MADLPFNPPSPQKMRSRSFEPHSQETTTSQESDPTVQPYPDTTELTDDYFLVAKSCLLSLFRRCTQCGSGQIREGSFKAHTIGSALVLQLYCLVCDQTVKWAFQPMIGEYYEGNLKLTTASYTTAVPIPRLIDMGKELGVALPTDRTMKSHVAEVIMPAVDIVYQRMMREVEKTVRGASSNQGAHIAMDGRYSKPGFNAPNCTVSFIDLTTYFVLKTINMHTEMRDIEGVSGRMEKAGVKKGLEEILANQIKVKTVVTDNDARISKMMREEPLFSGIRHLLDFWHLVKGIRRDLLEVYQLIQPLKFWARRMSNVIFWRNKLVNHAYACHYKFKRNREKGLAYWKSALAHVTGRHEHFAKIPFLSGCDISRCRHKELPVSPQHEIDRKSEEFRLLKAVIHKPTFLAGFLRASPKKNTSPCESFNSIINMYLPKRTARTHAVYNEMVKLPVLHTNTIAQADLLNMRPETSSYVTRVRGRETMAVKRRMTPVDHYWRKEVWNEVEGVIDGRKEEALRKRIGMPDSNRYIAALAGEMDSREDGEGDSEGEESDVSVELGYGEEVDSDSNPIMDLNGFSDEKDSESEDEEEPARREEDEMGAEMGVEMEESIGEAADDGEKEASG